MPSFLDEGRHDEQEEREFKKFCTVPDATNMVTRPTTKPEGIAQSRFPFFLLEGQEFTVACRTDPQSGIFIILGKYEGKTMKTPPL